MTVTVSQSKKLISQDKNTNECHYTYTYHLELPSICKDDLVLLPKHARTQMGGIGPLVICTKVTTSLRFVDPVTC
jgi:nonsense-mediated mRNA decay protein 3